MITASGKFVRGLHFFSSSVLPVVTKELHHKIFVNKALHVSMGKSQVQGRYTIWQAMRPANLVNQIGRTPTHKGDFGGNAHRDDR